jgi:hypothetical protein
VRLCQLQGDRAVAFRARGRYEQPGVPADDGLIKFGGELRAAADLGGREWERHALLRDVEEPAGSLGTGECSRPRRMASLSLPQRGNCKRRVKAVS